MCLYLFEYGEQNVVACLNVDIGEQSRPVHLTTEYGEMQGNVIVAGVKDHVKWLTVYHFVVQLVPY